MRDDERPCILKAGERLMSREEMKGFDIEALRQEEKMFREIMEEPSTFRPGASTDNPQKIYIDPRVKDLTFELGKYEYKLGGKKVKKSKTWNSKLIISLAGIGSTTLLAALGVISGGAAVPVILGIIAGYGTYRAVSLK